MLYKNDVKNTIYLDYFDRKWFDLELTDADDLRVCDEE